MVQMKSGKKSERPRGMSLSVTLFQDTEDYFFCRKEELGFTTNADFMRYLLDKDKETVEADESFLRR